MRPILLVCVFSLVPAAHADELNERFTTVWESLWTQQGFPTYVIRWADEVRVRFIGGITDRYREHAMSALRDATQAAGLKLRDVTAEADAEKLANLEFRVTGDYDLEDTMPCTHLQRWRNWLLERVLVQVRPRDLWRCTYHEVMHAMGIRGHPSGRTVLSYFPYRRDQLMPMDVLMLKSWYSPRMKPGATPFEALQVLIDAVVEAGARDAAACEAQARFMRAAVEDMERYARGEGEVPTIVLRSGRATDKAMRAGQDQMAYFVGVAYLHGIGVAKDRGRAEEWLARAAGKNVAAARVLLDRLRKEATP
jgi:hypothetical protein